MVSSPITGESLSTSYILLKDGAVIDKGRTAADGFSTRQEQDAAANVDALIGPRGPWVIEYHSGDERLPLAHSDEQAALSSEDYPS